VIILKVKPTMITAVPRLLEKVYDKKSMQRERVDQD
jgi:long-subunit acyl-CoA synthetase (AMP-forming)